jgi:hypothetical protein
LGTGRRVPEKATQLGDLQQMLPLRHIEIATECLYLDPNNPRFADLQDRVQPVPADRIVEPGVQEKALNRILSEHFEVRQLKESIRSIGFLPVDRLVVTPLPQPGKYVVIEGNRRLGAIRSLLEDHKNGEADLSPEVIESITKLPVLVIEEPEHAKREHLARVLQGVRHVSGIRPWGPYQQAQVVAMMLDDGKDQTEICEVLGLNKKRINILRRCFYALEQIREDDDYGDKARPIHFSYFDEVLKLPVLRKWLEWDDEKNKFLNELNRKLLYAWMVGGEDDEGVRFPSKFSDPKEVRRVPELLLHPALFKRFCDDPALGLEQALQGAIPTKPNIQWRDYLQNLTNVLMQIPAVDLDDASAEDEQLLVRAREMCDRHLRMLKSSRA